MGVNDLAGEWRETASRHEMNNPHGLALDASARRDCASDLDGLREDVWHPVSEPPTEADGDEAGNILIRTTEGVIETVEWDRECVHGNPIYEAPATAWARTKDVVLQPPA